MKEKSVWPALPFCLVALLFLCSCSSSMEDADRFVEKAIEISDYGLFDLGVADMNNDGRLDIFTVNHSGIQSMLLNNSEGAFTDTYTAWKMDQDHQFPGLAVLPEEPAAESPGIYVNWVGADVVIRFHQLNAGVSVKGTIDVLTSVDINDKQNVLVDVSGKEISPGLDQSVITFSGSEDGYFSFRPYNHALPFKFAFDEAVTPDMIHVGKQLTSPVSRDFTFQLRDRHGMTWADVNSDDRMDVFITRGGEQDTMSKMPISFWDELFLGTPDCMEDTGVEAGLEKKGCPGRQAAWVDFNGDNLLDIYVVCGRKEDPHPNMLFQQTADGRFEDIAEKVGLDIGGNGPFVWLDADNDSDMDLFWSDANGFFLFRNEAGKFSPTEIESPDRKGKSLKLTLADFDNDADLDVFSASMSGNMLFVNTDGNFSTVLPGSIGLPVKSQTANWVDYDNDGLTDLHAVPDGLYARNQPGKFFPVSGLNIKTSRLDPYHMVDARAAWFDVDNNGTRDLIACTGWSKKNSRLFRWYFRMVNTDKQFGGLDWFNKTSLFINNYNDNHWLQVQLTGPPGNRQAIGASVTLQTSDGNRRAQVGCAEGAHYGQGHYRIYFGLGKGARPISIQVIWPDGKITEIESPDPDRLLQVSRSEN